MTKMGEPSEPIEEPKTVKISPLEIDASLYTVPTLDDLQGVDQSKLGPRLYPGGESEALKRLAAKLANENWVATFEKPDTSPNSIEPSTTVLSPYLKFGCLSPKLFYKRLREIYRKRSNYSKPPVSLHGQLIWREFFNFCGAYTPNFDRIEGNPICRKIKWDDNEEYLRLGVIFVILILSFFSNYLKLKFKVHGAKVVLDFHSLMLS
jgi:cryptochrome